MKKLFLVMFVTVLVLAGCGKRSEEVGTGYSSGDIIEKGTYVYGKDIKKGNYMFNIIGIGSFKIESESGEEIFFYDNESGRGQHFMQLPFNEGDKLIIDGSLEFEFV